MQAVHAYQMSDMHDMCRYSFCLVLWSHPQLILSSSRLCHVVYGLLHHALEVTHPEIQAG